MPFTEAVDFLKSKVPMTKDEWNALNRKLQFRAFTMAKLGTATEIETAKQILADAVEKGETYAESWQTLKDSLGGNPSFKPGYWETVFRTNTQSAYMAGKLAKYADTGAVAGYIAFALLCMMPTFIEGGDWLRWHYLKSTISHSHIPGADGFSTEST